MADSQSVRGNNKPNYIGVLAVVVTVLNCILPVLVFASVYWFGGIDSGVGVDPRVLDRMMKLWPWLRFLWLVCIAVGFCVTISSIGTSYRRAASLGIWVCLLSLIFVAPVFVAPIYPNREKARLGGCMSNIKQISVGLTMYALDYDGYLPPTRIWNEALNKYVQSRRTFVCPDARVTDLVPCYSTNEKLTGIRIGRIRHADKVVLVFDSIPGKNKSGGTELLPSPPRHFGGETVGFADGHAKWLRDEDARRLKWKP